MQVLLKRRPSAPLSAYIDTLWVVVSPRAGDTLARLPTARAQVAWALPGGGCLVHPAGHADQAQRIEGPLLWVAHETTQIVSFLGPNTGLLVGADFTPGGMQAFTGMSRPGLHGRCVLRLDEAWGEAAVAEATHRLRDAMQRSTAELLATLETLLHAQLRVPHGGRLPIQQALAALAAGAQGDEIGQAARSLAVSERQFREMVRDGTGLTPKRYARLLRFARALRGVRQAEVNNTTVAAECGYFDQAHFNHEFKALSGMTPGDFRRHHQHAQHTGCLVTALRERLTAWPWWQRRQPAAQPSADTTATTA